MDGKNEHIVQSSISMIIKKIYAWSEDICLEYQQNLSKTFWGRPTNPRILNGVSNNLIKFPKGSEIPETQICQFLGGLIHMQYSILYVLYHSLIHLKNKKYKFVIQRKNK